MEKKEKKLFAVFVITVVCVAIIVGVSVYYGTKSSEEKGSSANVSKPDLVAILVMPKEISGIIRNQRNHRK